MKKTNNKTTKWGMTQLVKIVFHIYDLYYFGQFFKFTPSVNFEINCLIQLKHKLLIYTYRESEKRGKKRRYRYNR